MQINNKLLQSIIFYFLEHNNFYVKKVFNFLVFSRVRSHQGLGLSRIHIKLMRMIQITNNKVTCQTGIKSCINGIRVLSGISVIFFRKPYINGIWTLFFRVFGRFFLALVPTKKGFEHFLINILCRLNILNKTSKIEKKPYCDCKI